MSTLEPGRRVSEHLELVRPLGRGAMGEVWVARHVNLDTEVAVKFVHRHDAEDPEVRARFEVEAKAAAQLRCPHVVRVFDHGVTDDGMPFLVMELLEGETLDERLEREPQIQPELASEILDQVAKALTAAHEKGIVHRDVKPGNIFLCPDGEGLFVKLLDFGVARAASLGDKKLTQAGVMIGTPSYISREMVVCPGPVDHRADLWALAVVAYEMLTGDVPFTGDTVGLVCVSIVTARPFPASKLAPVPAAIDAFFARAFAEDIDARFQTASAFSAAFTAALAGIAPERIRPQALARRSTRTAAETLPPRAEGGERASVGAMISERVRQSFAPTPLPPPEDERRRRWPWVLAALALVIGAFVLHDALLAAPTAVAPAAAQPLGPLIDAPLQPPTSAPPSTAAETESDVDADGGESAVAQGSENKRAAPPVKGRPGPKPASGVGRDDYGF